LLRSFGLGFEYNIDIALDIRFGINPVEQSEKSSVSLLDGCPADLDYWA
jgi:hypothetical protein